ncbi:nuclear transport factor 2 family protein [Kordia sp.]|uniref:nuclear transport factor 2 family protein n=1 Tax=Kordia sp. TaxID=1965332 RepID=UPI003B59981B
MCKSIFKLVILVLLVSSCNNRTAKTNTIETSEIKITQVEEVLNAYMSAWAAHDVDKIGGFFAEDVKWYNLPVDDTMEGKAKVTKAITDTFMGNIPDMYWARSGDVFITDSTIVYEWIYGGTFNGKWGDINIENKNFSIKGMSTTTINKQGKITAQKDYYDFYSLQKALGIIQ